MPPSESRLFGTDGIRRVVGSELTPEFVTRVGCAVAAFLGGEGPVLIAHDFRTTSPGFAYLLTGTLASYGVEVVEMGVLPTPALQFNVRALGARLGLTVTASHNPTEFNGIKFTGPEGMEIGPEEERRIEGLVLNGGFPSLRWERACRPGQDHGGVRRYAASIRDHVDREAIERRRLRVILDPGNGTSTVVSPTLLRELGVQLTTLNAHGDGFFPGRPSEPTERNLADLRRMVVQAGADLGIAHDGDSDRVAFVDEKGNFLPGEVTLALFARYVLERQPESTVVTSVTSSSCVHDVVTRAGSRLVVTRSGSLPVARGMVDSRAAFGGEENGGYYWPEHQVARDGPMSSAKMLELLSRQDRSLSSLVAELPQYVVLKVNLPLPAGLRSSVVERVGEELNRTGARLERLDGVKAFFPDGWLLVRPSGTEPVCRLFAESKSADRARELLDIGSHLVTDARDGFAAAAN